MNKVTQVIEKLNGGVLKKATGCLGKGEKLPVFVDFFFITHIFLIVL